MKNNLGKHSGFAAVEMILFTPILILLIGGIIELSQLLYTNNVLVGIAREGANLVSRTTTMTPDEIMSIVATTSGPLELQNDAIIYITQITGQQGTDPLVIEQHRWSQSGIDKTSEVWSLCRAWTDGMCNMPNTSPSLNNLGINLDANETIYAVEIHYRYAPLTNYFYDSSFIISDITFL